MIFFTDLDGTVIKSASKKRPGDIVIEYKDGCEITCISSECAEILAELTEFVIPVTSRSIEQYRRIKIPGFAPKYALVSNGGNLLINGVPNKDWRIWSSEITEKHSAELEKCRKLLETDKNRSFEIRLVDGLFLFTKSDEPEKTLRYLNERLNENIGLDLYNTGAKIYAIPKGLNKGAAVLKLAGSLKVQTDKTVCAGDSIMDIPMLKIAGTAVYPEDLNLKLSGFSCRREDFCEFTVKTFKRLH